MQVYWESQEGQKLEGEKLFLFLSFRLFNQNKIARVQISGKTMISFSMLSFSFSFRFQHIAVCLDIQSFESH